MSQPIQPMARAIVSRQGRIVYDVMPTPAVRAADYDTFRRTFGKEPDGIIVAGETVDFPQG